MQAGVAIVEAGGKPPDNDSIEPWKLIENLGSELSEQIGPNNLLFFSQTSDFGSHFDGSAVEFTTTCDGNLACGHV
jgi:hypothetical protein